jgi:hypothetical protein
MRSTLHLAAFSAILITTLSAPAQNDRFAYAITDLTKDGMGWNALRKLDLQTGQYSNVLLNGTDASAVAYDATTKKLIVPHYEATGNSFLSTPFSNGVAAMAYDKKHNRLYYTPMFLDQLRYLDLSSMKLYYVTGQPFTNMGNHHDQGKIITRMAIAPDGNGYAVSSDGNTFIKFTTGKKVAITQLGSLVDDPSNQGISIHNQCSSFGGDMVADDAGNLLIITARNHVFKVNTESKIATHLGFVQGLSKGFTVNGVVADAEGNLLVSSALNNTAYYVVDLKTLQAKPFEGMTDIYRSSDLANSNYISTNKNGTDIKTISVLPGRSDNFIRIYPNPVVANRFTVQFRKVNTGDYTVELTNVMGQRVFQRKVNINSENQLQEIPLSSSNAKGFYLVKVYDLNNKAVFEHKVMVQ